MAENEVKNEAASDVRTDAELDRLADDSDKATNRERPMSEPEAKPKASESEEFEFIHGGKPVRGTREQILKWAQQGYDYPQRAQKLNQEKAKWEQEKQKWEQSWGIYKQIDEYAAKNKEWWDFIQKGWQNRGAVSQPATASQEIPGQIPGNDPYAPKFQLLEQKISQLEPLVSQFMEEKKLLHEKAEDEKLDKEIKSIREQHADLDWVSLDENGKSLELRVLEHAQKNGIPTFKAAFRDLLHDELITKAQSMGKLAVAKGIQNRTKLGVLGESPTPTKGVPVKNRDIRKTSYEELEQDIREELRLMRS